MTKIYTSTTTKEKTTLVNLENGAKSTIPIGTRVMVRTINLGNGVIVYTAFQFIGDDRCYVLTRTIQDGKQVQNFKMRNASEEIINDRKAGLFRYEEKV